MRKFEAVDIEALNHLVDVIVFPAKGPRPHPDEMSGSDLDGDKYFVTWYGDLEPERSNEDPMDFTSAKKKVLDRPVQVSDMIQFVADYIKNDQLGIIANAHTVHADKQPRGNASLICNALYPLFTARAFDLGRWNPGGWQSRFCLLYHNPLLS